MTQAHLVLQVLKNNHLPSVQFGSPVQRSALESNLYRDKVQNQLCNHTLNWAVGVCRRIVSNAALSYKPSPNVINLLCSTAHQCHCCYRTVSCNCAAQDQSAPPHPKILGSDVTIHNRQLSEGCQFSFAKTKKRNINNNTTCVRDAI